MPRKRVSGTAAALVFALLTLATVAAFAWSQKQKRDPLVLDKVTIVPVPRTNSTPPAFTPNGDCRFDRVRIRFRTTQSDDGTVQVIRPGGRVVVTLARDEFLKRYKFHTYFWDGRQRGGGTAPPGRYKLRVRLIEQDRTLVPPGVIRLHRAAASGSACTERAGTGGLGSAGQEGSAP